MADRFPLLKTTLWWLACVVLILGCLYSTFITLKVNNAGQAYVDDYFRQVLEPETYHWRRDTSDLPSPLRLHKETSAYFGITSMATRCMAAFWAALAIFLGLTLYFRVRRESSG